MSWTPKTASVVIPCCNYERYLRRAIDTALFQSRPPCDVIVVDDGSVDGSRAVIESFGDRIRAVVKQNGGHASAINAGCRMARGDVVFLLDADDELCPDTIETVMTAWRPDTVMAHWRPSQIDAEGRDIPGTVPAPWIPLEEGDLREQVLTIGCYGTTVTSGIAIRRDALLRILPIPEERFRQGADGYIVRAIAFHGSVQAIDRPLSRYRRHGLNDSDVGTARNTVAMHLRKRIDLARNEQVATIEIARQHGFQVSPSLNYNDPELLFVRLASVKLAPTQHPIADDSPARLITPLIKAQWRSNRSWQSRVAAAVFAGSVALLPRPVASTILVWRYAPTTRPGWLRRLALWRHGEHRRRRAAAV